MRVVIADDESLLREGLVLVLERAGFDVVAAVGDATSLVSAARAHGPDVVITDIRMPPGNDDDGLRAGLSLKAQRPRLGLVVLSQHLSRSYALQLLSAGPGGVGYLWKQRVADATQFAADLRTVGSGGFVLDPDLAASAVSQGVRTHDSLAKLTGRQLEVLRLLAQGLSNQAIAEALFITEKSVVEHVSKIYDGLGLPQATSQHRRVQAVLRFLSSPQGRNPT